MAFHKLYIFIGDLQCPDLHDYFADAPSWGLFYFFV